MLAIVMAMILSTALISQAQVLAEGTGTVIHIQTQEDLEGLAESCRLDSWSRGKTVVLDNDLTLDANAVYFLPIPSFGGTFDGGGHTISGLSLTGTVSRAGLFDTIQAEGAVMHLTVVGQVNGGSSGDTIGGIAGKNYGQLVDCAFEGNVQGGTSVGGLVGINETTGQIINCRFQGAVTGEHYVGGIAGQNTGSLVQCENQGDINTTVVEVQADLSDITLLRTSESVPAGTDIGGIAGFSSGLIQSCTNEGAVGYEHMGYNVGGIAGRQSGYLDGCTNIGTVRGRKDVGGIAGQMEPQVIVQYSESAVEQLWTELDKLEDLVNQAANSANAASSAISGQLNGLLTQIGSAKSAAEGLGSAVTDWAENGVGELGDLAARLAWATDRSSSVLEDLNGVTSQLDSAAGWVDKALDVATQPSAGDTDMTASLQEAKQRLTDAAARSSAAVDQLHQAVQQASGALQNGSVEGVAAELGSSIQNAASQLSSASGLLGEGLPTLEGPLDTALPEKPELPTAEVGDAATALQDIAGTLMESPAIPFTPVDSSVTDQGGALSEAISEINSTVSGLQGITLTTGTLAGNIQAINQQVGVINDLMEQSVEEVQNRESETLITDISDEDAEQATSGRLNTSVNYGEINGDGNVAGIVGSLAIEYDFDPEDDLTENGEQSLNFQYNTLAVVTDCVNQGTVTAKKDNAGGIVGRMDLGAIKSCESYGSVGSTGGDYVGGIAGCSRATIRDCYVKCTLSGGDYVGGVLGAGEGESVVSGCYTLVDIPEASEASGAISGTEFGELSDNFYVSDNLAGLGRISYSGKAEPMTFEELTKVDGTPEEMTQFTLRFVADGEEIQSQPFSYGDSFGAEVVPDIPEKEGYYAVWDTEDLTELHFDKTVTATYYRYVLTLPSEASRESGRPVFLLDGDFDEDASLSVSGGESSAQIQGQQAVEQWTLQCSNTTQTSYTVRYLTPEESPEGFDIYVRHDGWWEKTDCTTFGSYLVFSLPSADTEIAVVPAETTWLLWVLIGAAALIVLLLAILLRIVILRRKKKRRTSAAEATLEEQCPATHAPAQNPAEFADDEPVPEKPSEDAQPSNKAAKPRKKRRRWLLPLVLVLLLLVLAAAWYFVGQPLLEAYNAYDMLRDFAGSSECAMTLSLDTELGDDITHADIDIQKTKVDGSMVTCISRDGLSLYYSGGAVILDNGRAFKISSLYPDYSQLPLEAANLFDSMDFMTSRDGKIMTYSLTAEGEKSRTLLNILLPEQMDVLPDVQKLLVELTATDGAVVELHFTSEGTLTDEAKTRYTLSASLTPAEMDGGTSVPEAVLETVRSGAAEDLSDFSEDLFRLISAWTELNQEEGFSATLQLEVACDPILLQEDMNYAQINADGQTVNCISKGDLAVYYSDGVFCDRNGLVLSSEEYALADRVRLLEVLYQLCLNGEFTCTETGDDSWLYTLKLDQTGMESIAYTVSPEMESMPVTLTSGSIQIYLEKAALTEIRCNCTGGLSGLAETDPVTVSAQWRITDHSVPELPGLVKDKLMKERTEGENGT